MQNTGQSFFFKKFIETGGGAPPVSYVISSSLGSELTVWTSGTNNSVAEARFVSSSHMVALYGRGNTYLRLAHIKNNNGTLTIPSHFALSNQGTSNPNSNTSIGGIAVSGSNDVLVVVPQRDSTAYNGNKISFKRITFNGTTMSETSSSVYITGTDCSSTSVAFLGQFSSSAWYAVSYNLDLNNLGTTRYLKNFVLERNLSNNNFTVHDDQIITTNVVTDERHNTNTEYLTSSYDSGNDIMSYYYVITTQASNYYHMVRHITGSSANPVNNGIVIVSSSAWNPTTTTYANIAVSTATVPYLNLDNRVGIINQGRPVSTYYLYNQFGTSSTTDPTSFDIMTNRNQTIGTDINGQFFDATLGTAWGTSFNKVSDGTGLSSSLLSWNIYSDNGNSDYITTKTYLVDQNTFEAYQSASSVIPTSYTTANAMSITPTDPDWGVIVYAKPTSYYLYARSIKIDKV